MGKIKTLHKLIRERKYRLILSQLAKKIGFHFVPPYPSSLFIEPNNTCNLKCPLCVTGTGDMNRPKRFMKFEEFKQIIDQGKAHVKDIQLCNYGEPFLNKDIFRMIDYAVSKGIVVLTSTNGTFFRSEDICKEVIRSGLQHLIITLDGADQDTISKYRVGADFNEVLNGYKLLVDTKRQLNSKTPTIELQFMVMRHNEHQNIKVKEIAQRLGVDMFCEKTIGLDYRNTALAREFLPTDLSETRYLLDEDGTYSLKGKMYNKCNLIYSVCVINSDGSVVPCCYDAYSHFIMGNVFEESLKNIWKGDKYRNFRKTLRKDRKSISICNICSEGRYVISKQTKID